MESLYKLHSYTSLLNALYIYIIYIICGLPPFLFFTALSDWYEIRIVTLYFLNVRQFLYIATQAMRIDAISWGRRGISVIYRIATGLVCYWTIARTMIELSAIGKYECIFFAWTRKNGMSIGATGSRLEPMTGPWLVQRRARVQVSTRCYYATWKYGCHRKIHKYRRTFNTARP